MNIQLGEEIIGREDYRVNEAYKTLRTNVLFCGDDNKVVAVTSATPGEGKSTVSLNLAVSLAELGKKVLYIDADLRKSVMALRHRIKDVPYGLSHYLSGIKKFNEIVCTTNVKGLHMILAGPVPPNPSELLGSKYMKGSLIKLRDIYDYIIVDTPPMGSVVDARIIASQSDGVVLVIQSDEISYKFEQKMITELKNSDCKILGAVLNKVEIEKNKIYGKYYGKYYGNYGKEKLEV